jgi:hypothetical protein
MNSLTRLYIKTALIFFLAALLVRLAQSLNSLWEISPLLTALGPVYFHLFLVGWVTQLIFGMVYWMFPKYTLEKPRGREWLAGAVFGLLNLGLLLRVVGEPLNALNPSPYSGWILALSALLQWTAGMGFLVNTWQRVKEK